MARSLLISLAGLVRGLGVALRALGAIGLLVAVIAFFVLKEAASRPQSPDSAPEEALGAVLGAPALAAALVVIGVLLWSVGQAQLRKQVATREPSWRAGQALGNSEA